MTFQPPPGDQPPGNQPAPGGQPPSGQWGPPPVGRPGGAGGFDPKTINPLDWGILGAGVLAFIFSLFDYYTASVSSGPYSSSASESAWHGFFGWFAALLAIAGAVVVAVNLFMPQVQMRGPARLIGLGLFAVATISVILALFVFPEDVPNGVDTGRGFGYWASLIVIIVGLVLSLMRLQQTGGTLPGALSKMPNIGGYGPQGGLTGGSSQQGARPGPGPGQPPPPPGYGPPQPPASGGQQPPPPPGYGPPQ